ncbi:MAG: DNA polymerase III subunit alpha [Candidatus Planktophila sp.]|nr:DNA polymerase III subunit alpha [Candidatus Planktophila sp.]
MSFIHLNVASGYSLKYGTTQPGDLVQRAAEFEMPALALTDRDGLAGAIRFTQSCVDYGIAPIIGVNCAIAIKNINGGDSKGRITLLAHSDGGWRSLCRLMTSLIMTSDTRVPVLTLELLKQFSQYSTNVYAMHGPESPISNAIQNHRFDHALSIFNQTRDLFAGNAIECVSHLVAGRGPRSTEHAARSLIFARDNDLEAVITNAVRMKDRTDGPVADVLDCVRQLVPLHDRHIERRNAEGFLKSSDEMISLAAEIARAAGERTPRALLKTTREWAERSLLSPQRDIGLGAAHLPEPHVVGVNTAQEMRTLLRTRSEAGINWRYSSSDQISKARARLDDELATVATLGFESYFLTVADIADMARNAGIRVAARGSGAGSLICHLLGISGVEPMQHGLLMERFCSPLRRALPDIDIDVESARRLEIYDMVFKRYGDSNWATPNNQSRCAVVSMVDTYRARHAIRDAGAALGLPGMEIDMLAKSMPHVRARNIAATLQSLPELRRLNTSAPLMAATIEMAQRLDGLPRHLAMHPCAIVLSDGGFLDRAPLMASAGGYPMVAFDKDDVEAVGLLKLDVLGVRMQSTIAYSLKEIERVHKDVVDIDTVPLDDTATYELIQSTRTLGIFQVESPGQRELVGKLAPNNFTDLIIDISLFRPGPVKSDMITPFLKARHGWSAAQIIHPDLYEILAHTEGVVVFHEQVIQIIATMTGVSLATADEKRRSLGDRVGQQEVCDWFFPAATAKGYELPIINEIWDVLRAFASFGFCKAHAAAFALPTYQSAWLKTHYPAAFLAGVLTHDPGMYPKRLIVDEARQMGIAIAPIDVNASDSVYRVEDHGNAIRIALSTVSGISDGEVQSIIAGRPYIDLNDFVRRSGCSTPVTESLILTGGFDSLHVDVNRRDLLLHFSDLQKSPSAAVSGAQMNLGFDPPALISSGLPAMSPAESVKHEVDRLGIDMSRHMIEFYGEFLNAIGAVRSSDLLKQRSQSSVLVAGIKVAMQTPPVRSGKRVIFVTLDDGYGLSDSTFFTDVQSEYANVLYSTSLLLVRGVTRRTGAKGISIRATGAWDLRAAYESWSTKQSTLAI